MPIQRALLSVSDKSHLVEFARGLHRLGIEILSTGGTAALLRASALPVIEVADYTGFPEMLDGRVKTLHPKIHGALLARRDLPTHVAQMQDHAITPIDLVVVNLYPFRETVARQDCTLHDAVENIDIGGPALLRAAAKNYEHVTVLTDPADYVQVLEQLQSRSSTVTAELRFSLAAKAFSHTAEYDGAISSYLTSIGSGGERRLFPERLNLQFNKMQDLRYGENPHQEAALYRDSAAMPGLLAQYRQVQGKELSYNNLADADAAWECVKTFDAPACVIVKHANPCGVAVAPTAALAYEHAFATDPASAFGGILAFNRELGEAEAQAVTGQFLEVLIAPGYSASALEVLKGKSNVRVLTIPLHAGSNRFDYKRVGGGMLVQTPDAFLLQAGDLKIVSAARPSDSQVEDLLFAFRVAKFVKSNAIVYCRDNRTLGIGAGQMSRVDSARLAAMKAAAAGLSLQGSVAASDAFFPFRDGVEVIAEAGARAIIQPGGSVRDQEVIAAADELGIAMLFTGMRHFRH